MSESNRLYTLIGQAVRWNRYPDLPPAGTILAVRSLPYVPPSGGSRHQVLLAVGDAEPVWQIVFIHELVQNPNP